MRAANSILWVAMMVARPRRADELEQDAENMVGGMQIEIAGRLVRQEDARRIGDRARDCDALLLAARELRRPVQQAVAQAEIGQKLRRAPPRLRSGQPFDHLRQHDVFHRGEFRQQVMRLIDEADLGSGESACARRRIGPKSQRR